MQFLVDRNIFTKRGKKTVWIEPGFYPVVRLFNDNRVIIDCSTLNTPKRQITILNSLQGTLTSDSEETR